MKFNSPTWRGKFSAHTTILVTQFFGTRNFVEKLMIDDITS